jgi:hypothetical protein
LRGSVEGVSSYRIFGDEAYPNKVYATYSNTRTLHT